MIANLVLIIDININIYIYIYWGCYYTLTLFHLSLLVLFLFSLYAHAPYFIVCNILFLFHIKMPWWFLFKVFQKYRLSNSFMLWTLFLQKFSRVCVRIDFIVFNKWVWVEWFMTCLRCSFVCCGFVMDCQKGGLLGHMWIMLRTYVIKYWLILWQNTLYL